MNHQKLGFIIKRKRMTKKILLQDMAAKLGISRAAYSNKESGKAHFTIDQLCIIADVLNINLCDILSDL